MQQITVKKTDENGETIQGTDINFVEVLLGLRKVPSFANEYPWLSSVDPYGDTLINQVQKPLFLAELKKLEPHVSEEESKEQLRKTIALIEGAEVHEYIKFIGD
ncbi:MAG: hypothetical protein COU11_04145 [Candidatus Harrisonbacteria bacterium CG10_big_fil_rev_8_21_14_0_10_49_15]|uniref:Uncharacterized protein n=1 Tax=Candidatus Harrisonbacteria bacterium CG10_big_fil_rev_8_21_14_0_10_49_15 TaxID=1974587 RepID=A0A2H0UJU7_9BACT|nr:MAG: hypothetical protein COU11_04145 [Candidatus Harrisonbacteria bacterium CG10_big_fil_rev_8_21_14_0_10_49_15]